ncbi:MAG: hypothetical protein E7343_00010 [Clostridiales bacterium]|nr:hypothetical protein [Clostridiales bacterium]
MTTEEFFKELALLERDNAFRFDDLRARLPFGVDGDNRICVAGQRECVFTHACVTGRGRTEFIRRFVLSLVGAYANEQTNFVILSPKREYADLLRLNRANVVAPLINNLDGVWKALEFARTQALLKAKLGESYGKLFLVLDGLETLSNGNYDCYLPFLNLAQAFGVDIITGVDFLGGIFEDRPQDFVGAGNCLITVSNTQTADVVYAQKDGSLTLPVSVQYPSEPSVLESLAFVNKLS